jgi:hypothetical protein
MQASIKPPASAVKSAWARLKSEAFKLFQAPSDPYFFRSFRILAETSTHKRCLPLTSRLQKGGALLSDMRQMVGLWSEDLAQTDPVPLLARSLPKTTMARVKDTFTRAFRPRFISGNPPGSWRMARALEDLHANLEVVRPFYYWITARAEPALYGFVTDLVYERARSAQSMIRIEEAIGWLDHQLRLIGKAWTPTVIKKVARGMMAALRDFGILEGAVRKRIAAVNLCPEAFALIAFCLHDMGATGRDLVRHPDWRLFLLVEAEVERLLMECHQHGWLKFEAAGDLRRTEFPSTAFKEYAHVVLC